jgi:hypothetical protein
MAITSTIKLVKPYASSVTNTLPLPPSTEETIPALVQALAGQVINVVVEYLTNRGLIEMLEPSDILQIMALIQDAVGQALAEHVATYHQAPSPEH